MDTHFVSSTHSMGDMIGRLPEQNYPILEPNYSRQMYQTRSVDSSYPADCSHRPTHLPVNFDFMSESYQSRLSPGCEPSLYDMQDTPLTNGYLEPELCEDLTRGLNIHKSNIPPNNPSKISQSGILQKAQKDLAWRLKSRLTAEELISKGILLGREQSPNIIQKRIRLERAKTEDQLKKNLLARPPKGKLIDGNILKEFSGSPRLHQCQMSIMRKQIMKKLNEKISERPRAQALIKKGILCPPAPPLNECLQSLKSSRRTHEKIPTYSSDYIEQASPNNEYYKSQSFHFSAPHNFDQLSSEYGISRDERDQLHQCMVDESSPDCSIIEDSISNPDNSALDRFSVSSKFPPQNEIETCSKHSSLSKRITVRNPINESTLKKDMNNTSSLKTRSGKRSRKGIKTYKYHEYIPCPHSGNGLAKSKILGKTHLTKTALTVPKNKNKSNLDMEVQQEQLLLQLHLLRQHYPALMPKIYNDLVTQLSQIEEKEEAAKRKYTLEELESMTVTSLKILCKEHNVPSTGKKAELIARLKSSRSALVNKDSTDLIIKSESSKLEIESCRTSLELGGHSPGGEADDLTQSTNLDCVPDQISISSPLSEVSQYSAASSDSYTENNSPHNPQRTDCDDMSKMTSLSDPDLSSNEFNSNLDAVKFLDDSFSSIQCGYQRNSADDVIHKKQLFKYTPDNRLTSSSSLPAINGYLPKPPSIPCHSKHSFNSITEDVGVYDLLQQLDSYEKYEMNLNRSLPTYQHRTETGYPYEELYYPGGVQQGYSTDLPMKPMGYEHNSYPGLPFTDTMTPLYTPDMSMEWNTPLASTDPFSLSDLQYDVNDYGGFGRSENFQDIYHNSLPNSIDCDI